MKKKNLHFCSYVTCINIFVFEMDDFERRRKTLVVKEKFQYFKKVFDGLSIFFSMRKEILNF